MAEPTGAETVAAASPDVRSEVGELEAVVVHRPGRELERLTPENMDDLLFEDVPWVQRAQEEHDVFRAVLASRGAGVLELTALLADVLEGDAARDQVLDATLPFTEIGPEGRAALRAELADEPAAVLAERLVEGVTFSELPSAAGSLAAGVGGGVGFALRPLPNHVFTRDTSVWVGDRVLVGRARMAARAREVLHLQAIHATTRASAVAAGTGARCSTTATAVGPSRAATSSSSPRAASSSAWASAPIRRRSRRSPRSSSPTAS